MANEITALLSLGVINGEFNLASDSLSLSIDQAASGLDDTIVTVTTSAITISPSAVSTLGYALIKNLDATNYVDIGPDSTGIVPFMRLKAGEAALLRLTPGITIKAQANTASCKVRFQVLED